MKKKQNWIANPTKKQAIFITALYTFLVLIVTLFITDIFSKFTFNSQNLASVLLIPFAIFRIYIVWKNYLKLKRNEQ
jgi:Mn2+/Fe2+ NRAMP family transporter